MNKGKKNDLLRRGWRHEAVRKLKGLTKSEKSVLKDLIHRANDRGYCWPSYRTLAADGGCCKKTIQRAMDLLEEKQLIRRRRFIANSGRQGSYSFAVTLPISVRGPRHFVPQGEDAESSHKDKDNYKNNSMADCYRLLEDDFLKRFWPYIDWNETPELLSVSEVTAWAVARADQRWDETKEKLLQAASQLQIELDRKSANLKSWKQLIDAIPLESAMPPKGEPGSLYKTQQTTDEWVLALLECVDSRRADYGRLQRCLTDVTSRETPDTINFETDSRFAADLIAQECRNAFQALSNKLERRIALHCRGQKICEASPAREPSK